MTPLAVFRRTRQRTYSDDDLTFFMLIYRDHEAADRCLARLRSHFPHARVIVRSDGDGDQRHPELIGRYGVEYHAEPRLFPVENGGAVIARMLELFLQRPTRYLFKIDPDTMIHRRFRYLPAHDALFGTLQGRRGFRSVQGGCMGLTLPVAERILASRLLENHDLRHPQACRDRSPYWKILARRADRVGLASFDWALGWAALELRIAVREFGEVHSRAATLVDNRDLRYAITHPEPPS